MSLGEEFLAAEERIRGRGHVLLRHGHRDRGGGRGDRVSDSEVQVERTAGRGGGHRSSATSAQQKQAPSSLRPRLRRRPSKRFSIPLH